MVLESTKNVEYLDIPEAEALVDYFSPEEQEILETVNKSVATADSLDAIMDFLFSTVCGISPCDRISLAFLVENGEWIMSHYVRTLYEPLYLSKGYTEEIHESSLNTVVSSGKLRIIRDLEKYLKEHPKSNSTRLLLKEGIRSSMAVPLFIEGKYLGILFRNSRKPNAYGEHHIRMHAAIAERFTQAIEKAYIIEELRAANRAYFEMLGFVSHELKNPVASIVTEAKLLMEGYLGDLNQKQFERIRRITKKGEYLLDLIREYLDLARLEGGDLKVEFRPGISFISDIVDPAIEMVHHQAEELKMIIVIESNPEKIIVECSPGLMKTAILNLMSNAVKYSYDGGEIRIKISLDEKSLRVSVMNEGPGFTEEDKKLLFRKFSRLRTPILWKQKGTGLGLYNTWRIIQLHNGRIHANSESGRWAEFSFEIPQPVTPEPKGKDE